MTTSHYFRTKCILPFIIVIGLSQIVPGQSTNVDSLQTLLETPLPDTQRMDILIDLTDIMQFQDPKSGIKYGEEAMLLARPLADTARMTGTLSRIGACYANLGDINKAEELWRETLALEIARNDSMGIGRQYTNIGTAFDTRGDLDSAIWYHDKALAIFIRKESDVYQAIVYNNLAIDYEIKAEYPKSLELYLEALNRFEKIGHKAGIGAVYSNVGNVYSQLKAYDDAISYFNKSQAIKKEINDRYGIALNYNNLGTLYLRIEQLDSALLYNELSMNLKKELGDKEGEGQSILNLGAINYKLGKHNQAIELSQQAYDIAQDLSNNFDKGKAALQLGKCYIELGQLKRAENHLLEAQQLTIANEELETKLQTYEALYRLYKIRRDPRALSFHEKFVVLNDSIRNDEQLREITRLELKYQFDKEKEILALERQQEEALLQSQLQRQRVIRNASLGGLGAGLFIILLLWRSYAQKRKTNGLLAAQNKTIQQTLEERETLLKEIHHRVKNNLQVISSLLSLQSRTTDDPIALGALEEGRNRVKAMALIHQNLYQEENLVGVSLPEYISKLTDNLINSYQVDDKKIRILQKVAPISLDVDTLIPLALILNELISNSLKYAFDQRTQGEIAVEINQIEEGLSVCVRDDGIGLPTNFTPEKSNSLGFKLIRSFATKMKAQLEILSQEGTQISLLLPRLQ